MHRLLREIFCFFFYVHYFFVWYFCSLFCVTITIANRFNGLYLLRTLCLPLYVPLPLQLLLNKRDSLHQWVLIDWLLGISNQWVFKMLERAARKWLLRKKQILKLTMEGSFNDTAATYHSRDKRVWWWLAGDPLGDTEKCYIKNFIDWLMIAIFFLRDSWVIPMPRTRLWIFSRHLFL